VGNNRDRVFDECQPEKELAFSDEEFQSRLKRICARMDNDGIDILWLMAPESLYYVSGVIPQNVDSRSFSGIWRLER
jgi:hypothetical protein